MLDFYELSTQVLGEKLRALRKKRGLTQSQLGELIGVKKATISKLEKGVHNATLATIRKAFAALRAKVIITVELKTKEGV